MKQATIIALGLIFLLLIVLPGVAMAGVSACYNIANADDRVHCMAKVRKDRSYCYSINDASKRAMCIAEVGK